MDKNSIELLKNAFGENLQRIRTTKRKSLLELSYNCSIDESKISKIEHGKFDIKMSTIFELARGLEIHPKKLLDFEFDFED